VTESVADPTGRASTGSTASAPLVDEVFDLDGLLSAEERRWQLAARAFATERILPTIEQDFESRRFRRELVPELGAAGFLGMHLTGYGCAGAGAVSYGLACLELEAADSGWRTFVSVQGSLAMTAIHRFGTELQKQRWLPGMAAGTLIGCFALTEPSGGSDPAGMLTTARREGDGWVLDGTKRWIGLASVADVAVVWAQTDAGVRGFLVPAGTPGFTATPIDTKLSMRASIQCDVRLDAVRLSLDALLPEARGLSAPFSCLNEARFGIVWGAMGAARSCLDAAIARARSRQVFGRPIGANQLIQAKLADMLVEYEKGVLLALHLGRLKERGALTPAQISVGKLNSVREALRIASEARSILGGDGITSEFPVMRHLANLESVRTYEGTDEIHQLILGRALTGLNAFA
jgi:glutaryl-CoA dehydrogenase